MYSMTSRETPPTSTAPSYSKPGRSFGPNSTHGIQATYARGCRCTTEDGFFRAPQTTGCREAWRDYRRDRERARRQARRLEEARALLREAGEL
jgi:hypothetical protein